MLEKSQKSKIMLWIFDIFDLFLRPGIWIQETPGSGSGSLSETLREIKSTRSIVAPDHWKMKVEKRPLFVKENKPSILLFLHFYMEIMSFRTIPVPVFITLGPSRRSEERNCHWSDGRECIWWVYWYKAKFNKSQQIRRWGGDKKCTVFKGQCHKIFKKLF